MTELSSPSFHLDILAQPKNMFSLTDSVFKSTMYGVLRQAVTMGHHILFVCACFSDSEGFDFFCFGWSTT
jgi:hypothetical protein